MTELTVGSPEVIEYAQRNGLSPQVALMQIHNRTVGTPLSDKAFVNSSNISNSVYDSLNNNKYNVPKYTIGDIPQVVTNRIGYINGTNTPYIADQGILGRSNLAKGQTTTNPDGTTTTGGYLWDSTSTPTYEAFNKAHGGNISLDDYNKYENNALTRNNNTTNNIINGVNAGAGLAGLGANIYFANKNLKLQKEAQNYARSRDKKADAKIAEFQHNLD